MTSKPIEQVTVGSIILPPARELSLWMRRQLQERGLSESALHLTVREIYPGTPDKNGPWMIVKCEQSEAWAAGQKNITFSFKARPSTPWPVIEVAS